MKRQSTSLVSGERVVNGLECPDPCFQVPKNLPKPLLVEPDVGAREDMTDVVIAEGHDLSLSGVLRVGSLFSGVGGLDMAVEAFFGARTVWQCEFDPEPSKVLAARWPGVPNHRDVTTVDWSAVEPVDILCGGFPCQDLSLAGRRAGMRPGTRSGLWADFVKAIRALRPSVVVIENVRGLLSGCAESEADSELGQCPRCADPDSGVGHAPNVRALGRVLGDLADLGFDAEWHGLLASDVGAPHGRFRVFVLAYARGLRLDARWSTVTGEAPSGWASALVGGRSDAPVDPDRALLRTPVADELGGGPLHPDVAKERGQTLRLSGQVLALGGHLGRGGLLPTPRAARGASATETMYRLGAERDDTGDRQGNVVGVVEWGEYAPAIRLWESLTRTAPAPTLPDGKNGRHRLAAVFPEWMMGYPAGHVTDILARNPAIKACGNGVVPQQCVAALGILWGRASEFIGSAVAA